MAFLVGILFNLNPSCGSGTLLWTSTQRAPSRMAMFAAIRIGVLALVGALAGFFGTALRVPWGILLIVAAMYLLYTTLQQAGSRGGVCALPTHSAALPWLLALVPPPSGYIGLAIFYGGFNAPSAPQGALTLTLVGLGLTLPVWLMIFKPEWGAAWQRRFASHPGLRRAQIVFQFAGAAILTAVGLAFIFLRGFHRPLLELVQ
ncbi:MAG TPA: hypothetical protein VIM34_08025 [Burkholderiaceae bacterium]